MGRAPPTLSSAPEDPEREEGPENREAEGPLRDGGTEGHPPSLPPCLPSGFPIPEALRVSSKPAPALGTCPAAGDGPLLTYFSEDLESLRAARAHLEALTPGYCLAAGRQGCPPPGALGAPGREERIWGWAPQRVGMHGGCWVNPLFLRVGNGYSPSALPSRSVGGWGEIVSSEWLPPLPTSLALSTDSKGDSLRFVSES